MDTTALQYKKYKSFGGQELHRLQQKIEQPGIRQLRPRAPEQIEFNVPSMPPLVNS